MGKMDLDTELKLKEWAERRRRREVERQQYLRNCATTIQGQLGIHAKNFQGMTLRDIEVVLRREILTPLIERLEEASDEQIGKLACAADETKVQNLAVEALIPAILLKVWAAANPGKVLKCRFCDWTTAKFARIGAKGFERLREHIDDAHPERAEEVAGHAYGGIEERDAAEADFSSVEG